MKKKVVLTMLALQLVLIGTVGCSNNDTPTEASVTTEASSDSNAGSEQLQISGFDFDRAISNITIDGENIQLPTTLNELGEEYTLTDMKECEFDYGTTGTYDLMKGDKVVASVTQLKNDKLNIRDTPFIEFCLINEYASIEGIKLGDNIEKVKEIYGEPTKFHMDVRPIIFGDIYSYEKQEGDNIEFATNEKGKIIKIYTSLKSNLY